MFVFKLIKDNVSFLIAALCLDPAAESGAARQSFRIQQARQQRARTTNEEERKGRDGRQTRKRLAERRNRNRKDKHGVAMAKGVVYAALMRLAYSRRGPLWPAAHVTKQQPGQKLPPGHAEKPQESNKSEQAATTHSTTYTTASLKQRLWPGLGLPPAKRRRWDLPRRESAASVANTATGDADAITAVLGDTYTAASRRSVAARIDWWERAAKKRGLTPFPLEHSKLTLAGALLKQGKYKSASQYL